ncbi:pyridoxal phosphate-dependent transferase [Aspergillus venezuelensis]
MPYDLSQQFLSSPTNGNHISNDISASANPTPISPTRICITNGTFQNLASIMEAFTDPIYTRRIWMVEPTYFHACTIFEDAGFQGRLVGIPEDEEGLDVQFLRGQMEIAEAEAEADRPVPLKKSPRYEKLYRHVIYLVPTFSNPSAKTYTLSRKESLVRLEREFNALLVTDDCYDFLSWALEPPPTSSSTVNALKQETIGGFFLYIVFPEGIDADDVAKVALEEYNLRFLSAGAMAVRGSPKNHSEALLKRGARLCWAWEEERDIVEGAKRVGRVF